MALGAMEKYGKSVYIIPCGLNYSQGHRFRGKCLVEFGRGYKIPLTLVNIYKEDRRKACSILLDTIKSEMENVIMHGPNYEFLEMIHLCRRLYQGDVVLTPDKYIALHHRFLEGWKRYGDEPEFQKAKVEVAEYSAALSKLGLKDKHIDNSVEISWFSILLNSTKAVFFFLLAVPGVLIGLPLGLYARHVAEKSAVEAVSKSEVKLKGTDVIASKKVVVALKFTIPMYLLYCLIVAYFWGFRASAVLFFCLPIISLIGIHFGQKTTELIRSVIAAVKIKFNSREIGQLRKKRDILREKIIELIQQHGPKLAGTQDFEEWLIIKPEQQSPSPRSDRTNFYSTTKAFKPVTESEKPIISDDLLYVWS
eukprot:TRINITY_DN4711_c0_g2_i3.p1 TRINITY_DN4711_c0_g2~~TRINITY_DN4711_c0_g2_i3.p1  ORF type:complete len:365 (-),score=75.32 TRINITY_DN4711_c0_g2_i3:259-1353(-)